VQAQLAPASESAIAPLPLAVAPEPAAEPVFEATDAVQPPMSDDAASVDVWVELPPAEDAPRRGRSRRGRGRAAAVEATAPASVVVEPEDVEPEIAAPTVVTTGELEAAAPAIVDAPVIEVAAAVEESAPASADEPAPAPFDANEIVAPPATPKRGWWRRGA
jgi:ribonuclease E